MEKTRIVVCGAAGKMGSLIIKLALDRSGEFEVKAGVESAGHPLAGKTAPSGVEITSDAKSVITGGEVVVDFSVPKSSLEYISLCSGKDSPYVTGITGFTDRQAAFIRDMSSRIPVFFAPNMSFGVNLFFELVKQAAELFREYDTEVSEVHHRFKKDAPSGTARKIAEIICSKTGKDEASALRYGREGISGARPPGEIGMHSLRMGDVVGEHYVYFGGTGEVVEVAHRCYNRESFALGALKAAAFTANKPAGIYGMGDLIKEVMNVRGE